MKNLEKLQSIEQVKVGDILILCSEFTETRNSGKCRKFTVKELRNDKKSSVNVKEIVSPGCFSYSGWNPINAFLKLSSIETRGHPLTRIFALDKPAKSV